LGLTTPTTASLLPTVADHVRNARRLAKEGSPDKAFELLYPDYVSDRFAMLLILQLAATSGDKTRMKEVLEATKRWIYRVDAAVQGGAFALCLLQADWKNAAQIAEFADPPMMTSVVGSMIGALNRDWRAESEAYGQWLVFSGVNVFEQEPMTLRGVCPIVIASRVLALVRKQFGDHASKTDLEHSLSAYWTMFPDELACTNRLRDYIRAYIRTGGEGGTPKMRPYQIISICEVLEYRGHLDASLKVATVRALSIELSGSAAIHRDNFREWTNLSAMALHVANLM
jgi:hypothetical protein